MKFQWMSVEKKWPDQCLLSFCRWSWAAQDQRLRGDLIRDDEGLSRPAVD